MKKYKILVTVMTNKDHRYSEIPIIFDSEVRATAIRNALRICVGHNFPVTDNGDEIGTICKISETYSEIE
jgi:hypothetical protein